MNSNDYLLSIVIPTKNRNNYCKQVIKQVLNNTTERTQVVIQDNNDDNDDLEGFVKDILSERVVYNHEKRLLSFVDNFSEALSFASGKYVCMIGDDDGVLPNIETVVKYADENQLDAIIPGLNSVYIWPNDRPIVKGGENGYLVLTYLNNHHERVDVKNGLEQLVKNGFQDYQKLAVPRLYHGLVSSEILQKIKDQVGSYFGGLTPDMYMTVALALVVEKAEMFSYPITISGICPQSGSSASATGAHTGKLEDAPHFRGHETYDWNNIVPPIYTVETIWADTGIHALNDFNQEFHIDNACKSELYAILWKKYEQFHDEIAETAEKEGVPRAEIEKKAKGINRGALIRKVIARIKRKPSDVIKNYNVKDIYEATNITLSELKRRKIV